MAVPKFEQLMLPVLEALADGSARRYSELVGNCADALELNPEDIAERMSNGRPRLENRIYWAALHLVQAGLLRRPERGKIQITDRGRDVLTEAPEPLTIAWLDRFDEHREFRKRSRVRNSTSSTAPTRSSGEPNGDETPWEKIDESLKEHEAALAAEVLQRVYDQEPVFLERLVLRLLTAMGYGGRAGAAEHWGRSGDGGIDGVIRQDVLGLDRVYLQAKRYSPDHAVGRPDIQAFVGALHGQQADRGVFITTSRFSADAAAYVERIPNRIVLIDGHQLAELMILHNVGVQDESTFVLKRIDEDFFEQP